MSGREGILVGWLKRSRRFEFLLLLRNGKCDERTQHPGDVFGRACKLVMRIKKRHAEPRGVSDFVLTELDRQP